DISRRRWRRGAPPRSCHLPQHSDQRCSLLHNRHDRLWLDGAILEGINDRLLDFDLGATSGANSTGERNGNVAVDVHGLIRNGNEIAGAHTRLGRNEQSPRTRLKNCHADNVSVAEANILRSTPIRKFADKPRRRLAQDVGDFGRNPDEGVWNVFGVVLPGPYIPALGPGRGHQGAAARCKVRHQECQAQKDAYAAHGRPSPHHGTLPLRQAIMSDQRAPYLESSGNGPLSGACCQLATPMVTVARFGQHRSETQFLRTAKRASHLKWLFGRDHGVRCPDAAPLCTRTAVTSFLPFGGITYGCKRLDTTEEGAAVVVVAGAMALSRCPLVKKCELWTLACPKNTSCEQASPR